MSDRITADANMVARIVSYANVDEATIQAQAIGTYDIENPSFFHALLSEQFPPFTVPQFQHLFNAMNFPEGTTNQEKLNELSRFSDLKGVLEGTCAFRTLGGNGQGNRNDQFHHPMALCMKDHEVYITDYGNQRVQVWNVNGTYSRSIGPFPPTGQELHEFGESEGIVVGEDLFISDKFNHRVQQYSKEGTF